MRLHAVLFPETAYRLEGFTINPKNKELAPVVSQPHVEVDTTRPVVTKSETDDLMAVMGFAPVQFIHDGVLDDGYYAYPSLTAEDLANAWNYARSHREEMDREIAANGDDT